jgi:hypothetical protein
MNHPTANSPKNYTTACYLTINDYYNHVFNLFPAFKGSSNFQNVLNSACTIDITKSSIKFLINHHSDSIYLQQHLLSPNFYPEESSIHIMTPLPENSDPRCLIEIKPRLGYDGVTEHRQVTGGKMFFNNLQKIFEEYLTSSKEVALNLTYNPLEVDWEATLHSIANSKSTFTNI